MARGRSWPRPLPLLRGLRGLLVHVVLRLLPLRRRDRTSLSVLRAFPGPRERRGGPSPLQAQQGLGGGVRRGRRRRGAGDQEGLVRGGAEEDGARRGGGEERDLGGAVFAAGGIGVDGPPDGGESEDSAGQAQEGARAPHPGGRAEGQRHGHRLQPQRPRRQPPPRDLLHLAVRRSLPRQAHPPIRGRARHPRRRDGPLGGPARVPSQARRHAPIHPGGGVRAPPRLRPREVLELDGGGQGRQSERDPGRHEGGLPVESGQGGESVRHRRAGACGAAFHHELQRRGSGEGGRREGAVPEIAGAGDRQVGKDGQVGRAGIGRTSGGRRRRGGEGHSGGGGVPVEIGPV
mmetsp:Transcript_13417/g.27708  ORF Transcript_13417/g.27708 Transcript_13417/m.27708 type:complete len:347 (+) Transcript_13417:319-1359(+)